MRILIVSQTPRTTARTSRLRRRTGAPSTPSPTSYVPIPSPAGGSSYQPSPSPSYAAPSPGDEIFLHRKISCLYRQYCRYRLLPDDARVYSWESVPVYHEQYNAELPAEAGIAREIERYTTELDRDRRRSPP